MRKNILPFLGQDKITGALIFIGALFLYYRSAHFAIAFHDPLGPAFFPRIICIGLMCLSLLLIVSGFRSKEKGNSNEKQIILYKRILGSLLIIILYLLALENNLGYIISTSIFLFFYMLIFQEYLKIKIKLVCKYALFSLLTTLVIYYLFDVILDLMVP